MECIQQRRSAWECHPVAGVLHEQTPQHLRLVGHAGVDDRVVDVADRNEAAVGRRYEDLAFGHDRLRRIQPDLDRMPEAVLRRRLFEPQMDAEIAIPISRHPLFQIIEAHRDHCVANAAPDQQAT